MAELPRKRSNRKGRYYTPRPIRLNPNVKKGEIGHCDVFNGSMEDLIASGFGDLSMYPGQPGVGLSCATYRPVDVEKNKHWCQTPGYMSITRQPAGNFIVRLAVSIEERKAREDACAARREAQQREVEERRNLPARPVDENAELVSDSIVSSLSNSIRSGNSERVATALLDSVVATAGLDVIRSYVERAERLARPRPRPSHLHLIWSAPRRGEQTPGIKELQ